MKKGDKLNEQQFWASNLKDFDDSTVKVSHSMFLSDEKLYDVHLDCLTRELLNCHLFTGEFMGVKYKRGIQKGREKKKDLNPKNSE